ncbi:MAG TPA: GNAT family N-acetyltransferase [Pyrinomonadaceae bacterium]|nr:GNAT family N-acetyltransferase [Pyrinomonadaceae bacterium]
MDVILRSGKPEDAESCGSICYEAFSKISDQHNFPRDFTAPEVAIGFISELLGRNDVYSIVAEANGRIVGSNFLWENNSIAGVGPITIDPDVQNAAAGRRLMEDVISRARQQGFAGIRLVQAAYHSRSLSLYTKLGFDTREPLSTLQGSAFQVEIPGHIARQAEGDDLEACNQLCLKVHGHERGPELLHAIKQGTATVVEHDGRITGYASGIGFFGHAVGESNEDLKALIGIAKEFPGPGFMLPTRNSEMLRWCLVNGLRVVQPMTLMSMGMYNEPQGSFLPSVIY